jgi:hypothetical protein
MQGKGFEPLKLTHVSLSHIPLTRLGHPCTKQSLCFITKTTLETLICFLHIRALIYNVDSFLSLFNALNYLTNLILILFIFLKYKFFF